MIPTRQKTQEFRCRVLAACAGILASLLLLSCPNPIDKTLANQVEDEFAPVITIINPDPTLKYYYPSEILIEGTVNDFVERLGGTAGEIASLTFEEQFNKRIAGTIDLAADGSFSFTIDTLRPEILQGTQYIVITAVDWNDNVTETIVTAYDKTTGPLIGVDITYTEYTSSPAAGLTYTVTGVVGVPTFYLTYDVEPESGPIISGVDIPYNPLDGEFGFPFKPSEAGGVGVSGELKFIIKAEDNDGPTSYIFYLQDDPVGPVYDAGSAVAGDNTYVDLIFDEGIYHYPGGTAPLATDFSLGWSGGSGTVTDVLLGGFIGTPAAPAAGDTSVRLALVVTGTPAGDETLTITASNLTDAVGNPLSPASLDRNLTDKIAPVVMQVRAPGYTDGAYNDTETIPIVVTFDGPVTVTSPLTLNLNSGAAVTCSSGTDITELTFNYSVAAGDNTPVGVPLNYTSITALTGGVVDGGGNAVTNPTLPDPAGLSALGVENIVIDTAKPGAPVVTILDGDGQITKAENEADVPFTITGEDGALYTLQTDASWELEAGSMSGYLPVSGLELCSRIDSGTVTVTATLTDAAGNVSDPGSDTSQASILAPYPPDFITVPHATNDPLALDWEWKTGGSTPYVGNGNYRYKVNDPDLTAGAETQTVTSGSVYYDTFVPSPDVDGSYTLYVQEENNLGNWSDSASCELILDRVNPVVTAPASTVVEATENHGMSSTWTDDYYNSASVSDDRDASPDLTIVVDGGAPPSALKVGYHDITFTGTDHAGNTHVVNRTLAVKNTVFLPAGGEKVAAGDTNFDVTWAHDGTNKATIALYKGSTFVATLDASVNDDGGEPVDIPAGAGPGTDYKIRVTDDETGMYSESAQFTIERVTVTSPNGGETWGIGTTRTITWDSSRTGDVRIVLRKNNNFHSTLSSSTANDGSYSWTIDTGLSAASDYQIRVRDIDTDYTDDSDTEFTLEDITISVTAPNGGESWTQGTAQTITWNATGGGTVKIELFKGGVLNTTIAASTANDGTHGWTVPLLQTPGSDYRIRVTSVDVGTITDESDADFSVTVP